MNTSLKAVPGARKVEAPKTGARNAHGNLETRKSQELYIALSGPLGSGVPQVRKALEELLTLRGYKPVHIRVSELFVEAAKEFQVPCESQTEGISAFDRISTMQSLGNELRNVLGDDMGAQLAIQKMFIDRVNQHPGVEIADITPHRTAYIIDQLKHPREVALLRATYGEMFYMVGVLCSQTRRQKNLTDQGMDKLQAEQVMDRDRKEADDKGQQLEKTLQHADFFLSSSRQNREDVKDQIERFLKLIHGSAGLTPNAEERGMFAAYSAGLRSACLSRQVGAAILDTNGNVISTGCNDVPAAGGGLYEPGDKDQRCFYRDGYCHNDKHKNALRAEISKVLVEEGFSAFDAMRAAEIVRSKTKVKDLIEFSRAVHAEMDAIVGVARTGVAGIDGATLYTTVYPCHNCARHIVAAGITKVIYIEPYEKSLAVQLHDDSIVQEPEHEQPKMVAFMHFEGVAPQKFTRLFQAKHPLKDKEGYALAAKLSPEKSETEYLDNYQALESRTVARMNELAEERARARTPE